MYLLLSADFLRAFPLETVALRGIQGQQVYAYTDVGRAGPGGASVPLRDGLPNLRMTRLYRRENF